MGPTGGFGQGALGVHEGVRVGGEERPNPPMEKTGFRT